MMPGAQVVASKFMRRLAGKTLARIADNVMPEVRLDDFGIALGFGVRGEVVVRKSPLAG